MIKIVYSLLFFVPSTARRLQKKKSEYTTERPIVQHKSVAIFVKKVSVHAYST
jgi:hypothetical protein